MNFNLLLKVVKRIIYGAMERYINILFIENKSRSGWLHKARTPEVKKQ